MKTKSILLGLLAMTLNYGSFAQVGIGTTNPDVSSILDVVSTDKGILIPRMTASERLTIATPIADGLMVYQTDDVKGFYYYDSTLGSWDRALKESKDAIPTGSIFTFPMATIPTGYLVCDGSAVSRTNYADLFAVLGTTYGAGNGSTTFNLPDYRGQFLRGYDNGAGNDPDAASRQDRGDGTTGDYVGTTQDDEMSSHFHENVPPSVISTTDGSHSHNTYSTNLNTNASGNHYHNIPGSSATTNYISSHTHMLRGERVNANTSTFGSDDAFLIDENNTGPETMNTFSSGGHNHTVNIPASNTNSNGNHNHSINIPSLNTNANGNHNHQLNMPTFNSELTGSTENRPVNITVIYCIKY
ncbi:tail fiber protein [Psychroserpens algicola]|uniref:Phage tail protein n=1 Tax=Psychroserpens algicola TaxID=1719034 RepID=A0ABT0H9L7_9FLAO|nr:tail fiber protein [Psychroserpens algicola]MCK8481058.1 phage tail protein [Psychroserpens algicola]